MGLENADIEDKTEELLFYCKERDISAVTMVLSTLDTSKAIINFTYNESEIWTLAAQENSGELLKLLIDFYHATQINTKDHYYQKYCAQNTLCDMIQAALDTNINVSHEVLVLMAKYITIPDIHNIEHDKTDGQSVVSKVISQEKEDSFTSVFRSDEHCDPTNALPEYLTNKGPEVSGYQIESWLSTVQESVQITGQLGQVASIFAGFPD
jgi:hypothetical protein